MIYANESLDELICMFGLMKSAKEVMKLYLRQSWKKNKKKREKLMKWIARPV